MTAELRLLLRLTVVSFVVGMLGSAVGFLAAPEQFTGTAIGTQFETLVLVGSLVLGFAFSAGLYALVYFPLRGQQQWAWILGIVLASMAILGTVLNAVLLVLFPAGLSAGFVTGLVKAAVDAAWLVVAARPGVRAALR